MSPQVRPSSIVATLALATLASCGTTSFKVPFQVDPPTARVYVNGIRVGQGDPNVYTVDFQGCERICIQAAAKGYEPRIKFWTREELRDQLNRYKDIRWTLVQERQ